MRILYATPAYKPAYKFGGPAVSVPATAEELVRKGHEVVVFTSNSNMDQDLDVPLNQPVQVDGVEVWYFKRREPMKEWFPFIPYLSKSAGFMYVPDMNKELERILPSIDIVHTHMPYNYLTYAAARAAHKHNKAFIYHQRGAFDPRCLQFRSLKKHTYVSLIERPIMQKAGALIALTQKEVETYQALGVRTPCRIVPNGIHVTAYRQEADEHVNQRWNIPPQARVVLFLSRLHPVKGADKLLQAFLRVSDQCADTVLVMAGPDEWGLEAQYKDIVAQAGLGGRVFFTGMVAGQDKVDLLARADLFCLPSSGEGFSMAVLEALASGTPVLLSPQCNFPEVEKGGVGRIVDSAPETLADALAQMLADPGRLCAMAAKCRDFVARNYTWDIVGDQLLTVYAEALQRNGAH